MGNNIFSNTYFGKAYKTRDGRKAIFIVNMGNYNFPYRLVVDGDNSFSNYNEYGRMYSHELPNDIVSEWQEEINAEELDKLAVSNNIYDRFADDFECENYYGFIEGFKVGYRKAKES